MLTRLITTITRVWPVTLKEAHATINACTEQVYLCKPNSSHNAKLVFVTGEVVEVEVTTLFKDRP